MDDLFPTLAAHYAGAAGRSLVRYFIVCGGGFAVAWMLLADRLAHRRIQEEAPARAVNLRELRDSVLSTLVIAAVTAVTLLLHERGMVQIYMDPTEHGIPWLLFTAFLLFFGFDTYFYWSHRLMHHVKFYNWTHEKHHVYTDPSPLAAYAFTVWEALAYAVFAPILVLLMPVNFWVLLAAGSWFTIASMLVHLGYELAPRWWGTSPFTRWIGTSTMHNMHHEHIHHNFALYFTFWDRAMGTMHPDYDETLAELTAQPLFQRPGAAGPAA